jgi:hypothetical protein
LLGLGPLLLGLGVRLLGLGFGLELIVGLGLGLLLALLLGLALGLGLGLGLLLLGLALGDGSWPALVLGDGERLSGCFRLPCTCPLLPEECLAGSPGPTLCAADPETPDAEAASAVAPPRWAFSAEASLAAAAG